MGYDSATFEGTRAGSRLTWRGSFRRSGLILTTTLGAHASFWVESSREGELSAMRAPSTTTVPDLAFLPKWSVHVERGSV